MAAGRDREAVRPRSALGQGAQCRDPEDAAGASDLPDGPFPRQGNGAEHHGAALRQRPVRAAVESPAHRPRPDHRGGDRRRRAPRQVLREDRRAARHGAQPRLPAAVADGHGAADLLRCRCGAGQEGRGHRGHTPAHAAAGVEGRRARPVRRRHRPRASRSRPIASEPDVAPDSTTETYIACKLHDRQLALGRRAFLPAHRQISEAPVDRDRHPLPPGALHAVPRHATSSG